MHRRRIGLALLAGSALAFAAAGACSSFEEVPAAQDAGSADATSDAAIDAVDATDATADAGPPPITVVSPSRDGGLTYPETITWTIAALPDDTVIRYTTDGTAPTPTSKSASGVVTLPDLQNGTLVKWTAGSSPTVHEFLVSVDGPDGGSSKSVGVILQNFRFATTTAPITSVQRGVSSINVSADIRLWNQATCPTCVDFLTVGIDKPSDCFAASVPGVYPGASGLKRTFVLSVPDQPGVYPVRLGLHQVFDCKAALAEPLSDTVVGMLVVTP